MFFLFFWGVFPGSGIEHYFWVLRIRVWNGQEKAVQLQRTLTLLCKSAPSMANDTIAVLSNWVIGAFRALVLLFI